MTTPIRIKRLTASAQLPKFATAGAACFDLHADLPQSSWVELGADGTVTIETGLAFEIPAGFVMLVYSRSGQGFKDNTRLANCVGVIDSDYRGQVRVKLTRDDGQNLTVCHGDRVAQCMVVPLPAVEFVEVEHLSETARGEGGYGSTGR